MLRIRVGVGFGVGFGVGSWELGVVGVRLWRSPWNNTRRLAGMEDPHFLTSSIYRIIVGCLPTTSQKKQNKLK
jgi:hypothetical protein